MPTTTCESEEVVVGGSWAAEQVSTVEEAGARGTRLPVAVALTPAPGAAVDGGIGVPGGLGDNGVRVDSQ